MKTKRGWIWEVKGNVDNMTDCEFLGVGSFGRKMRAK
jgi:hypothetical protein